MSDSTSAYHRARAIKGSLSSFAAGLVGLLPIVGLPFAVHAFFQWKRTKQEGWNPAARYATAGAALGVVGLLLTVFVVAMIGAGIVEHSTHSAASCATGYS